MFDSEDGILAIKKEKTNATRRLDAMKIEYKEHDYTASGAVSGMEIVAALDEDPDRVFKTLVTVGRSGEHYVFMLPVNRELDLKKAASYVGEKSVEMIKSKELLPLTGYIHGGCSPIGMKKTFKTTIHESAARFETIMCSGGRIGYQIELTLADLAKAVSFTLADVAVDIS